MKTEIRFLATSLLQKPVVIAHRQNSEPTIKQVYKTDLYNHRFALIDNRQIGNPVNWDHSWFAHYE